jgi:alpha-glucosidase
MLIPLPQHNGDTSISQEFYRWPLVATAAKNALGIRYRLLDYLYTAFHRASVDGTPVLSPLFYKYPRDPATFALDAQFFFGDALLVSPVTEENATAVAAYVPRDTFYDFYTGARVEGPGANLTLHAGFAEIPLHVRGGAVLPLRAEGAMTTAALRKVDFELLVAPDARGSAQGALYVDDGESVVQARTTEVAFAYAKGKLEVKGTFGYAIGVNVAQVKVLGVGKKPKGAKVTYGGKTAAAKVAYDAKTGVAVVTVGVKFDKGFTVELS